MHAILLPLTHFGMNSFPHKCWESYEVLESWRHPSFEAICSWNPWFLHLSYKIYIFLCYIAILQSTIYNHSTIWTCNSLHHVWSKNAETSLFPAANITSSISLPSLHLMSRLTRRKFLFECIVHLLVWLLQNQIFTKLLAVISISTLHCTCYGIVTKSLISSIHNEWGCCK